MDHPTVVDPLWGIRETDRHRGLIKALDRPGSVLARAARGSDANRLGSYFEVLLETWIDEVPPAELAASNWQAYAGSRTIGEFDLLFRRNGRVHHWELAVKFYLGHPASDGQFRWFGPNPKDRLDRKWAKIRGQQLRLHHHPAGQGALRFLGIDEEVASRAFIKGYLFVPLDDSLDVEYPPDINPGGLRGWWVHRPDLAANRRRLDPDGELQWMILPPLRWMSPAHRTDADRLMSFDTLTDVVPPGRPTLVVAMAPTKHGLRETTRGFVVPDRWP